MDRNQQGAWERTAAQMRPMTVRCWAMKAGNHYPNGLPWVACRPFAETPLFTRQADKLFSEAEKRDLIDYLAENPLAGDEIPGTGGVRMVRFGTREQ